MAAQNAITAAGLVARALDGAPPEHTVLALDAGSLPAAAEILGREGFIALRRRSGPRAFVAYDPETDAWPVITLTSEPAAVATVCARGRPPAGIGVALLGPDGAGKSTLAVALDRHAAVPVWITYMGLYPRDARSLGVPGLRLAGRLLRLWRRYALARVRQARGGLVIFDRYPYDALLPGSAPPGAAGRLLRALLGRCLPAPHLAVVLDAPGAVLAARTGERSAEELDRQRAAYSALAQRLPCRAVLVDAAVAPDAVRRAVTAHAWAAYHARHGR